MAGVRDLKFLRNGAGDREPKARVDSEPKNVTLLISGPFRQFYACTVQITAKHLMNLVVQLRFGVKLPIVTARSIIFEEG